MLKSLLCLLPLVMSTESMAGRVVVINLMNDSSVFASLKRMVPPLTGSAHKGQSGRVAVLGGSRDYTGAPFYAAISSLKFGGDLAYVFCEKSAAVAIKAYSPELMVTPFYSDSDDGGVCQGSVDISPIVAGIPRLHSVVLGPGLGRSEIVFTALGEVIREVRARNLPLVVDADGLFMLSEGSSLDLVRGYRNAILTPNRAEFDRLVTAAARLKLGAEVNTDLLSDDVQIRLRGLCRALDHVTVVLKGRYDLISNGEVTVRVEEQGSPRRCGGQGDVLAGTLGVAAHWANTRVDQLMEPSDLPPPVLASVLAATVTKRAAQRAFALKRRATTTPDIIEKIGSAFEELLPAE